MAVYHKHLTQRVPSDPYWRTGCTAYAAAMAINDSVLGGLVGVSGRSVRAMSDEPVPDPKSPGLNIRQVCHVAAKLGVPLYDKTGEPWSTLRGRVGSGASRAVLQIDYATLGDYRCQANGDFGHAVELVLFAGGNVRASDPLCSVTKVYPEEVMRAAAERFARDSGLAHGIRYAITRVVPKWQEG